MLLPCLTCRHALEDAFTMDPPKQSSHAYNGNVEYSSADSLRSRIANSRALPQTTRSRDDGSGMTTSREGWARAPGTIHATDSARSNRSVGLQAHHSITASRASIPERSPTWQAYITPVESSSGTSPEPPRPQATQRVHDLAQAQANNLVIEAAEHPTSSRVRPGVSWSSLFHVPPRYQDSLSTYLERLLDAYMNRAFGTTLETNLYGFLASTPMNSRPALESPRRALGSSFWSHATGTENAAMVRRVLISLDCFPLRNEEDVDPVPPYEAVWEECYEERFGWASVPAYEG